MTEGLSDKRVGRIVGADVSSMPSAHMVVRAEGLLDMLDRVYLETEKHPGDYDEQRKLIMVHIMLHIYQYGVNDGEDRAINRLVKVMQGVRN